MGCLSHRLNERQECANALLRGLRHPEWIATEHCAALFIRFVGEEIPESLDAVDTEFLQVAHNNACIQYIFCGILEDWPLPTPLDASISVGDQTNYAGW